MLPITDDNITWSKEFLTFFIIKVNFHNSSSKVFSKSWKVIFWVWLQANDGRYDPLTSLIHLWDGIAYCMSLIVHYIQNISVICHNLSNHYTTAPALQGVMQVINEYLLKTAHVELKQVHFSCLRPGWK